MAYKLTPEQRRKNMQSIRSKDTKPELLIAKELRKRKIYFASHVKKIFGCPDFVFRRKRVVVFIDSDFWHQHPTRGIMPKSNLSYWQGKLKKNKKRDALVNKELKKQGWIIIRIWEHNLKKHYQRSVSKIIKVLE